MAKNKTGWTMARHIKAQTPIDVILIVVFIFALGIGALVIIKAIGDFTSAAENIAMLNSTDTRAAFQAANTVNNSWDFLLLFLFVGGAIGMVVIGYFIDVHSVFLPFYIIMLIIGVILCGALSYVWEKVAETTTFSTIRDDKLPITNHILSNLAIYFSIVGIISMVATYAKQRGEQSL